MLLFGGSYADPTRKVLHLSTLDPLLYDQAVLVVEEEVPGLREILRAATVKLVVCCRSMDHLTPLLNLLRFNDRLPPMPPEERAFVCAARNYVRPGPPHTFHHLQIRCSPHQIQSYRRTPDLRTLTMSYPKHQTFAQCLTYNRPHFNYTGERCFANLNKYSRKLEHLVRAALAAPLLVYSHFLNGGGIPVALALEEAGFRRHNRPSLLHSDPGNGLKYAFISKDPNLTHDDMAAYLQGHIHVVVVAALFPHFPGITQIHCIDSPADLRQLLCPYETPVQVTVYTSLIDLDEEAADLTLYKSFHSNRLLLPPLGCAAPVTPQEFLGELFLRKLWYPRAELLTHVSEIVFPPYLVNRFGHYGSVVRVDNYYVFQPADEHETLFVKTRRGLTAWGAAAAPFLAPLSETEKDRVVAAHVVDTCGLTTALPPSPFQGLVAAHFQVLTMVDDVQAWVGPDGLTLWRKREKWVPERILPYLRTMNPDASQHTAPVELEIILRLEGRAFLRESDLSPLANTARSPLLATV